MAKTRSSPTARTTGVNDSTKTKQARSKLSSNIKYTRPNQTSSKQAKSPTSDGTDRLHSLPVPTKFSDVSIRFIGPIRKCQEYDSLMVITDRLTDYIKLEPTTQTATAKDIAHLFHRTWYRQFGLPRIITVHEKDELFTTSIWTELHHLVSKELELSTSYRPKTDESTLQSHETIWDSLRQYVKRRQTDWASHLVTIESVMNNLRNSKTQQGPNDLVFGTTISLFPATATIADTAVSPVAAEPKETRSAKKPRKVEPSSGRKIGGRQGRQIQRSAPQAPRKPPPVLADDNQYEIEEIVGHRSRKRKREYLVHWLGYPQSDNQWINERDIDPEMIRAYRMGVEKE